MIVRISITKTYDVHVPESRLRCSKHERRSEALDEVCCMPVSDIERLGTHVCSEITDNAEAFETEDMIV